MVKEENEPILCFDETRGVESIVMDESAPKAPILDFTLLDSHVEDTLEVQTQAQVNHVMEVQVYVHQVEVMQVLPMEIRSLFGSLCMPLESEWKQSKLEHK